MIYNSTKLLQNKVTVIVAIRLRQRRIMLGISHQELSKATNISVNHIEKYEDGSIPIAGSVLYCFAKLLNTPIDYFIDMRKTNNTSYDYLFDTHDTNFTYNIVAEDAVEYTALSEYTIEEQGSYIIKLFSKIQSYEIRQSIIRLIKAIVPSQEN